MTQPMEQIARETSGVEVHKKIDYSNKISIYLANSTPSILKYNPKLTSDLAEYYILNIAVIGL